MEDQTPEQVGRAALASLTASVKRTPTSSTTSPQRGNKHQEHSTPNLSASTKLMGRLWVLMTEMYGHKWTAVHGESDASGTWGKVLVDISGQQIANGMQQCATRTGEQAAWPPSAPEFREMCLAGQSNLGIPSGDAAWREAVEASTDPTTFKFSHPIVHECGRLTDWYSIRNGIPKAETVQNRFNKRYTDLTAKLQRGEPLIDGQLALTQELRKGETDIAEAKAELQIKNRLIEQGLLGQSPEELRAAMFAKLGIKR